VFASHVNVTVFGKCDRILSALLQETVQTVRCLA